MTIMSIMIIRVVVVVGIVGVAIWFQAQEDRGKVKSNSWHNGLGFTSGVALARESGTACASLGETLRE